MFTLLNILKWTARILSLFCISLILLFAFGEGGTGNSPTLREIIGLLFFPTGVIAGMIVAFKKSALGAIISISSLLLFYFWHYITTYSFPKGAAFLAFTAPAVIFLIYSFIEMREKRRHI